MTRMKKAKPGKRASGAKTKSSSEPKTVDEYLARVPEPARSTLMKIRATIRSAVPAEATEATQLWHSVIQVQGHAGLVRRVRKALQLVSHRSGDRQT